MHIKSRRDNITAHGEVDNMKQPIKKLKVITVAGALCLASLFSGCSLINGLMSKRPELPAHAESVSRYIPDDSVLAHIDVGGRTYVPFASVKGNMYNSEFKGCLGYLDDNRNAENGAEFGNFLPASVRQVLSPYRTPTI